MLTRGGAVVTGTAVEEVVDVTWARPWMTGWGWRAVTVAHVSN
jgi:hypothetical protein